MKKVFIYYGPPGGGKTVFISKEVNGKRFMNLGPVATISFLEHLNVGVLSNVEAIICDGISAVDAFKIARAFSQCKLKSKPEIYISTNDEITEVSKRQNKKLAIFYHCLPIKF